MNAKTEVLLAKDFGEKAADRTAAETELLPVGEPAEIVRAGLETKIYDENARFYDYGEIPAEGENAAPQSRRRKVFLTIGLALAAGGFVLLSGLAAGFYGLSEKTLPTATVDRPNDREPRGTEPGSRSETAVREAVASEKTSENPVERIVPNIPARPEIAGADEQKAKRPVAPAGGRIPSPSRPPETSSLSATVPNRPAASTEERVDPGRVGSFDARLREDTKPRPVWRRKERPTEFSDDGWRSLPTNERRPATEKVKQLSPAERSRMRKILRKQRRMS